MRVVVAVEEVEEGVGRRKAGAIVTRRSSASRRKSVDTCGCCRRAAAAVMTLSVAVKRVGGWVGSVGRE
jgi:hypothetical protein